MGSSSDATPNCQLGSNRSRLGHGDDDQEAMFAWSQQLPVYTADFAGTRTPAPDRKDFEAFLAQTD